MDSMAGEDDGFAGVVRRLADAQDELPREAMREALDAWDECGPRLTALLAAYADGSDRSEPTQQAMFVATALLAEKRETAAFGPLCRLMADAEAADLALGDALTENLLRMLVSTFDGDPAPLVALIDDPSADEVIRHECLRALAYLTFEGRLTGAWMRQLLARLRSDMQPQGESYVWVAWAHAVTDLGYADLADAAEELCRIGFIAPDVMTGRHVRQDLRRTLADPRRRAGFEQDDIRPYGRAADELAKFYERGRDDEVQAPIVNPLRHVGRNDPCPCGSGLKYKRCCLP
jgi:hypothetical protein